MKRILVFLVLLQVVSGFSQEKKNESSAAYQENLNKEFASKKTSPLMESDLATFKSLDFFPIDSLYIVTATFVKDTNSKVFEMKTSTNRLPKYRRYGTLSFVLQGKSFQLNVYQNIDLSKKSGFEDYLFLPFSDLTCGHESYIGGRYLDLRIPSGNVIVLDFNKAYNPYCAYNHKYSCPIVPLENDLGIEIEAGVKKFHD